MTLAGPALFRGILDQIQQQPLSPVKQAGTDIVPGQLQVGLVHLLPGQAGPGQQVLVNTDGAVHLAPLAQQVAQGNVGLQGFGIDLQGIDECVHRTVRTAVQQVVQALVILAGEIRGGNANAAPSQPPANADSGKQQQENQ